MKPLLGGNATEERVRASLAGASIIHLATHGLANIERPGLSTLVFAMPSVSSKEDGFLHAFEVEHLRLSADLVVLSACETGRGQVRGDEGVLALDRAFLLAGAKAVVSSLWVVDDDSTATLMTAFHASLKAGNPADVALAFAMDKTRAVKPDPYFWSGFRLTGGGLR